MKTDCAPTREERPSTRWRRDVTLTEAIQYLELEGPGLLASPILQLPENPKVVEDALLLSRSNLLQPKLVLWLLLRRGRLGRVSQAGKTTEMHMMAGNRVIPCRGTSSHIVVRKLKGAHSFAGSKDARNLVQPYCKERARKKGREFQKGSPLPKPSSESKENAATWGLSRHP